jgi:hypothetical protein
MEDLGVDDMIPNDTSFLWRNGPMGLGRLIVEVSISQTHSHPVEPLRMSDQLVAEAVPTRHATHTTDENQCSHRDSNSRYQQYSGRRPTP